MIISEDFYSGHFICIEWQVIKMHHFSKNIFRNLLAHVDASNCSELTIQAVAINYILLFSWLS